MINLEVLSDENAEEMVYELFRAIAGNRGRSWKDEEAAVKLVRALEIASTDDDARGVLKAIDGKILNANGWCTDYVVIYSDTRGGRKIYRGDYKHCGNDDTFWQKWGRML